MGEIIRLFQNGKDGLKSIYQDEVPQFIVGSIGLINTGVTLTAAGHVVIFDFGVIIERRIFIGYMIRG